MPSEFSRWLKHLMETDGVSQRALSIGTNIDRSCIRSWLNGRFQPKYNALIKVAVFFNVRIDGLLGLESLDQGNSERVKRKAVSMEEVKQHFLSTLKNYMDENNLTRYAMAKKIGVDPKALNNWFTKGSMPEVGVLIRLAEEMKMSVDELLGWEDKNKG